MQTHKRTTLLLVAALIAPLGSSTCEAFQEKTSNANVQIKTKLAEIDLIANEMLKDRKAVLKYRPNWDQCRALVKTREDAIKLYEWTREVYREMVRDGGVDFPKELKQFEIQQNKLKTFARDKADRFHDVQIHELAFKIANEKKYISCFIKVNETWAYFPMPWKSLSFGDPEAAGPHLAWIRMLHNERYEDAYQFAAPILRKAYSFEKFKTNMQSLIA